MTTQAFVQNTGVGLNRSTLPRTGLQAVCGATSAQQAPTGSVVTKHSRSCVRMTFAPNYSITLDTLIYNPTPVVSGVEDKDLICYNVWKQVFGNAYVMESEREEGYVFESMYRAGQITLSEFVRGVAKTETYKRRFFECCGPYRAVELNFKHLLGRGPDSKEEISKHVQIIANEGFEAEIDSYIDSCEYNDQFGDDFVPYMRFKGTYPSMKEFTNMTALYSSPGTTDKSLTGRALAIGIDNPNHVLSLDGAGVTSKIGPTLAAGTSPTFIAIKKAIPSRPDLDLTQYVGTSILSKSESSVVTRYEVVPGSYMYFTRAEVEEYKQSSMEQERITSLAQAEIAEAEMQIKLLEQKVAELNLLKQ